MRRLVWGFGWAGVVVWSLVCALAYGLFDLVGRVSMRNADMFSSDPGTVEGIWRTFSFLHGLSTGAITVGWAVVSLLILAVPWFFDRMLSSPGREPAHLATSAETFRGRMPPTRGGEAVIDLEPDQYSVGPPPDPRAHSGPAPRLSRPS